MSHSNGRQDIKFTPKTQIEKDWNNSRFEWLTSTNPDSQPLLVDSISFPRKRENRRKDERKQALLIMNSKNVRKLPRFKGLYPLKSIVLNYKKDDWDKCSDDEVSNYSDS
jgi:hypothetical protein